MTTRQRADADLHDTLMFLDGMRGILSRIPISMALERWGSGAIELDSLHVERRYAALSPEAREAFAEVQEWFRDLMSRLDALHSEAAQLSRDIGWQAFQVLAEAVGDPSGDGDGGPDGEDDTDDPDARPKRSNGDDQSDAGMP